MKKVKILFSLLLSIMMILSLMVPAFAAADNSKKFTTEKAIKTALTAAKAKYAIEGISSDVTENAYVTKVKYDKDSGSYSVTVRADRVYKYVCTISVKSFLGAELGMPENSEYVKQGAVGAFFGQLFEKSSYFFIKLFKGDGPKA